MVFDRGGLTVDDVDIVELVDDVELVGDVLGGVELGVVVTEVVVVVLGVGVVVTLELVEELVVLETVVLDVVVVIVPQSPEVTTLSSKVIAAPAYNPPSMVAPVIKLIDSSAKIFPTNAVVDPSVAELPTAQ